MRYYKRFTIPQIIQHWLFALSFLILVITGFSLMYAYTSLTQAFVEFIGGVDNRNLVHRLAAIVFAVTGYAHLLAYYIIPYLRKRQVECPIVPSRKDWQDLKLDVRYHLWLTDERPRFAKFSWLQKSEYWAGVVGLNVISVTGVMMWFMFELMRYIPFQIIQYAQKIHGWEAILAAVTVAITHTYSIFISPSVFPIDTSMFTGRVSRERLKEEHSLELEEVERCNEK